MLFQMIEPIKVGVCLLFHYCISKFQNFRGLEKAGDLSIIYTLSQFFSDDLFPEQGL